MKKFIISMIIIGSALLCIFSYVLKKESDNKNKTYESEYYSLELPSNWYAKNTNESRMTLYKDNQIVGYILSGVTGDYNLTPKSIVANWIGMHAYIIDDYLDIKKENYNYYKIYIGFEQSAAQQLKGETAEPYQLHYFYVKDNMLVDMFIDTGLIGNDEADTISNSLKIK